MKRSKQIADILQYGCNEIILQSTLQPVNFSQLPINFNNDIRLLQRTAAHYQIPSLSANQIRMKHRMFAVLKQTLIQPGKWSNYQHRKPEDYQTVINPQLEEQSTIKFKDFEECPSIPGMRFHIWNPILQVYKYHRPIVEGEKVRFQAARAVLKGFSARVWDHEVRHLNGILAFAEEVSHRDISVNQQYLQNPGMHEMVELMKQQIKFMSKENLKQYFESGRKQAASQAEFMPREIPEKLPKQMKNRMSKQYNRIKAVIQEQQKKQQKQT